MKRSATVSRPVSDAVSLTMSNLSGYDTNASREKRAPPAVKVVCVMAVARSSSRRYPVTCAGVEAWRVDVEVAERRVRLRELPLDLPRQRIGGLVVALEQGLPHLGKPVDGIGVDGRVDRPAGPQRGVVQQEPIRRGPAVHHGPGPAVPERQGLLEGRGRPVVPEQRRLRLAVRARLAGQGRHAGDEEERGEQGSRGQSSGRVRDARHRRASEGARYPLRVRASNREGRESGRRRTRRPTGAGGPSAYADADEGFLAFAAACLRDSDVWAPNFLVKRSTRPSVSMIF